MALFLLHKKLGETPLEAIERLKQYEPNLNNCPCTYAGRLDPAAEGLLLILTGEDCKRKDEYLGLPKTYQVRILFGVSSDTHDLLGVPSLKVNSPTITENTVISVLQEYPKNFSQDYPLFSSKPVGGKPLFQYGREGEAVALPNHEVTIQSINIQNMGNIASTLVFERLLLLLKSVTGDFRQEEIRRKWTILLANSQEFFLIDIELEVSSGFYVRAFADDLGKKVHSGALLYSLVRTNVGPYELKNALSF